MIQRILVATDLSPNAEAAWCFAVELARHLGAELRLIHVGMAIPTEASLQVRQGHERQLAAAAKLLEARAIAAAAHAIPVKTIASRGDPARVIATTARDENIDLLVVGTHDHHRANEIVAGSVAERLIRLTPCTIVVVKPSPISAAA